MSLLGYTPNLPIRLIQEFGIAPAVAKRLSKAYGGHAAEVVRIERDELQGRERGIRIMPAYPYLEAEVLYAVRKEWAMHAEDIIARRTRLAFLNKEAAIRAIPRVVQIMSKELNWDEQRRSEEIRRTLDFMQHFGGPTPSGPASGSLRWSTLPELLTTFQKVDCDNDGKIDRIELRLLGEMLNQPLSDVGLDLCIREADKDGDGKISVDELTAWWNADIHRDEKVIFRSNYAAVWN